jgi:hydroxymethylpyrimidine pyrophosphatase-like HAD family hydrolase
MPRFSSSLIRPVDAVVGENGAFTFFMKSGVRQRVDTPRGIEAGEAEKKFQVLIAAVQKKFPQAKWASDQKYREFDLAIDICEDVPPWPDKDVQELLKLCHLQGAHAKLSSVHVNAWFGSFDKAAGFKHFLAQGIVSVKWDDWLFIGDSPNDEPLFAAFKRSVGVANLKKYLDKISHAPTWLTEAESGAGFAEMAARVLGSRGGQFE